MNLGGNILNLVKKENQHIRMIPLGGVGEIAKNMYIVEVDDEMFMLDAGLMFPEDEMLGIDVVIPDINYVIENKDKLKGIFLSHGHQDAIGALRYIIDRVDAPIYGSRLTIAIVKDQMREAKVTKKIKYYTVNNNSIMRFKNVNVSFFSTTHSIPDSLGIVIHTSQGAVVYTGEFKFDQSMTGAYAPDITKMGQIGNKGVLMLISDSTEAEKPGYNTPENVIESHIVDEFAKAQGRIIVSCYASNFIRIQQVLNAAARLNRKVSFLGKSLESSFNIARKLGYFDIKEQLLVPIKDVEKYPKNELIIISTGSQGEPIEGLGQMALQKHSILNIEEGDTVFITTTPSSNMEVILGSTINHLVKAGAKVIPTNKKIHASGHGCMEELKLMLNLMKPTYFVPVQGEFKMQIAHAKLAAEAGVLPEHIFLLEKGDVINYDGERMVANEKVPAGNVLIDGIGVGDVGNIVIRDRQQLSKEGVLIVVLTLDKQRCSVLSGPDLVSRGFVYVRDSEALMNEAQNRVKAVLERCEAGSITEWSVIKSQVREALGKFLYEKTGRRPMILPIIMEV